MSIKKIKEHNSQKFIDDLKRIREVMVYANTTNTYFQILKKDLIRDAEINTIAYYITDKIFVSKREVMVII